MMQSAIATRARIEDQRLIVDLSDGRTISTPRSWFPRLLGGTDLQRATFELCGGGRGIHGPELDEDLSVEGLVGGVPVVQGRV